MNCDRLTENFDDYMDGQLGVTETGILDQHVTVCATCAEFVRREQRMRDAMKHYADVSTPLPDARYFDRALARAAATALKRQRNNAWMKGFASAVAAGLVVWLFSVTLTDTQPESMPPADVPAVTMTLEQPQTINLVFSSAVDMRNATLRLTLPDGIEIYGFAGQRELTWMTSLREGKNVLPLRLIATSPQGGEVLATLQHHDENRSFRLLVSVI